MSLLRELQMVGRRVVATASSGVPIVRRVLGPIAVAWGIFTVAAVCNRFFPIANWQVWEFLAVFGLCGVWWAGCMIGGYAIFKKVIARPLPVLETATLSFATGLLAFHTLMMLGGFAKLFGPAWFFVSIGSMFIGGGRDSYVYVQRVRRHLDAVAGSARAREGLLTKALAAAGAIALFALYLPIIAPSHAGVDSGWYHMPIAEHYVAEGGIRPFAEGWYLGTYPHLSSMVYCWALMLPGASFFLRVELAAHLEFVVFLRTLVGVSALVRRAMPRAPTAYGWVACFLFPTLFLHDTALAADHVAAFWAPPIYLALFHTYRALDMRAGVVLGAMLAGATLTKYTSFPILLFPIGAIVVRALVLGVPRLLEGPAAVWRATAGAFVAGLSVISLTSTHWLKNWVFYGDPLYPLLHRWLKLRPWHEDASYLVDVYLNEIGTYPAPRTLDGVKETLEQLGTFSFTAYEFPEYHRDVPYFGFLFTIFTLAVPFVRPSKRLLALVFGTYVGVFAWYWQSHVDRYLQALLPLMAVVVAVAIAGSWRSGWLGRAAVVAAVGLQVVWGADIFTVPLQSHKYTDALEVIGATYKGNTQAYRDGDAHRMRQISAVLPKSAKVLIHDTFPHMGLERRSVNDWMGLQGGINYGRMPSPRATYELLRGFGVTHLVWGFANKNDDSLAGDLRFLELAEAYAEDTKTVVGAKVGTMPATPPPDRRGDLVAFLACGSDYRAGLYPLAAMTVPNLGGKATGKYPKPDVDLTSQNSAELVARARFVVTKPGCHDDAANRATAMMRKLGAHKDWTLWVTR